MNQNAAASRSSVKYANDEYFAFVESADSLDILARDRKQALPAEWDPLLINRWVQGYGLPTRILWLDCVHASYFNDLGWRGETCDLRDPTQVARRRRRLAEIEPRRVANVLLLVNTEGESERAIGLRLAAGSWHRVCLDAEQGLPVLASSWGAADLRQQSLRYLKACSPEERANLETVFNPALMTATLPLPKTAANNALRVPAGRGVQDLRLSASR
ncbi:hypothetical protein D0B54_20580 [Solimonas sp. K1W22B-7]|uniref:hypothetical protein n=1 Tax=Solimonas sp. K1W22B-7 TaxID=2303331 RepID=UPI000E32E712|nr:hypothetical protein [Solimonas sp. K1W22B-7]AXQ30929.1 hypothetical protein D0B54_20580 [Solimonas sp. K1W22B-7]